VSVDRQSELDVAGKVVVITGASRGVGKQNALDFATRGAKVVLAARTVEAHNYLPGTLGETLKLIEEMGQEALAVPTDLAKEDDLKRLVRSAADRFGGVDILVNNAAATFGDIWQTKFLDLTRKQWLYQFDVNLHAPFTLTQLCVPIMERRGGGRIINVSAGSAEAFRLAEEPPKLMAKGKMSLAVPGYYSSKRALDRFGNCVAHELAEKNIAIIAMHPGFVATEIVALRVADAGLDASSSVPPTVPSRMIVYFSACKDPMEYTGRVFWAERELADMGISVA
jgi:NAD(P)-dependent dehydrogenase (short-subunit alcohol dehydrogenase family)